ncbi:DNA-methyltransferase [Methanofollis ethanolicus]|uniref:DNA-methyltransferase n=1 Tax=Methanofollis ethanolicus TaxID=488124 RepID=UPI0009F82EDC|nr:site-specific DNA-methyltransferase [Methanofollis ethanolicus]
MHLTCPACGRSFEYTGRGTFFTSCPACKKRVTIRRKKSETSDFGVSKRECHDARAFYGRKIYAAAGAGGEGGQGENDLPPGVRNAVLCRDSRDLALIPDTSVHLMVTSPPYNVGKAYDDDLDLEEYLALLRAVFAEVYRVLVPGGRACVNVANVGRKPYIPYHSAIIRVMEEIGFLMRGEVIWNKATGAGISTAWGSWRSASNPTLRDVHEYILVYSKGSYARKKGDREDTIAREEFLEWTKSVWTFPTESARKVGHPAPFPVELPYRCIQLYTFKGDVVLDPFAGAGTTGVAALRAGRDFVCVDSDAGYVERAKERLRVEGWDG